MSSRSMSDEEVQDELRELERKKTQQEIARLKEELRRLRAPIRRPPPRKHR